MTINKVTINSVFGDNLTVEEYEEKLRGDLIEQEIKELYPRLSGEFARTLHRGYKSKWADPITKAVSGRYLSSEEIRKENEEMAAQTQAVRGTILKNMIKHAGEWVTPKQLSHGTGLDLTNVGKRGSLSSAVSTLYPFLEQCGITQRRPDPSGRGYVYQFDPDVAKKMNDTAVNKLFEEFQVFERERIRRRKAEGTKDPGPSQQQTPAEVKKDPATEQIPRTVEQFLSLTQNGQALKVNVEFNVNIRFGLLKE